MTIKSLAKSLAVLTVLTLGFGLVAPAFAQDKSTPVEPSLTQKPPVAAGTVTTTPAEALSRTWIQWQPCCTALSAGFNLAFTLVVPCPGIHGCTFGFEDMIQVGLSGAGGNRWAICGQVDGAFIDPPCPFAGIVPIGLFETRTSLQNTLHVATGTHTLQVFVFVDSAATLGNSEAVYRSYIP